MSDVLFLILVGFVLTLPIALVITELVFLVKIRQDPGLQKAGIVIDVIGFILIVVLLWILYRFSEIRTDAPWTEQLYNDQKHAPIAPEYQWIVLTIYGLAIVSHVVLNVIKSRKTPPLVPLFLVSFLELGFLMSIVFAIQHTVFENYSFASIVFPPVEIWMIPLFLGLAFARTILLVICARNRMNRETSEDPPKGKKLRAFLSRASLWPFFAFLLIWPILGVLAGISCLVSEVPDAAIRAFTDTADWRLSTKTPPQQLYYDEHYLCTVAAGGHEKIVKPLRKGIRHGHPVVVNRQLEIANAFEQILEERTPRFHKAIRGFYDRYGFPVAKLIRTKFAADVVYVLMKPLEWAFLFVLYMTDVHPENRIALQYTGGLYQKSASDHHS